MCEDILPPPPAIRVSVVGETPIALPGSDGFMRVRRYHLVLDDGHGHTTKPFTHDVVERRAIDAAVIVAYFLEGGEPHVYFRSAVRPACILRGAPPEHDGLLWELPAGLIEPGEEPIDAAARELGEELGFFLPSSRLTPLGPWTFPAPGIIGERHLFFAARVEESERKRPSEDGSALEKGADVRAVALRDALRGCRAGLFRDAKTELGVLRLQQLFEHATDRASP